MADKSFCIDIGERFVKLAQVTPQKILLAKALIVKELPNNIYSAQTERDIETVGNLIKQLASELKIKDLQAHIVIPDSHSYIKIIEMPKLTEKELVSAIKYQADQFIPIPIENVSLDIDTLWEDKKNKKVMVLLLASANSVVDKVVSIVEQAGVIPLSVESEAVAALRFIKTIFSSADNLKQKSPYLLFANFGYSSTSLYLYNVATQMPVETHFFSLGLDLFIRDIQANFNVEIDKIEKTLATVGFEDAKTNYAISKILSAPYNEFHAEFERFITSVKTKYKINVDKILLFGEGINLLGLEKKLSASLGINTLIFNPSPFFVQNNVTASMQKYLPVMIPSIGANLQ